MFVMDIPYTPPPETPVVIAQNAATTAVPTADFILNGCQETQSTGNPRSAVRAIDPAGLLRNYLESTEERNIRNLADIKLTLLEPTTIGKLTRVEYKDVSGEIVWYRYDAPEGYVGNDRAVFLAKFEGKRYKIVLDLKVFKRFNENSTPVCPEPKLIEVKRPKSSLPPTPVSFAPLTGVALSQASDTGIVIDPTAAGHGWLIDPTPGDNSEFLPTSNPNEWIAKEGSAAYSKMDHPLPDAGIPRY